MLGKSVCTVVLSLLAATACTIIPAGAAAPLQLVPGQTVRSDAAAQRVAQYAPANFSSQAAMRLRRPQAAVQFPERVYLMHGFMNVFSLGLDDLTAKIRADGITAMLANHADAESFTADIVRRYQAGDHGPVVLIGHSLGADATIEIAQALDRYDIPVALIVLFDGTVPHEVPKNVAAAVNYTLQFDLSPGPGFRGMISNVDMRGDPGIDHFTIEKSPVLQARTLDAVLQAGAAQPRTSSLSH
jgi:pimeloyl-ACP methyl ester carboxylesterase